MKTVKLAGDVVPLWIGDIAPDFVAFGAVLRGADV